MDGLPLAGRECAMFSQCKYGYVCIVFGVKKGRVAFNTVRLFLR